MSGARRAIVVGAGIIGLTTAIRLREADVEVHVITADEPTSTTSVLASAMVGPTFGFSGPRVDAWETVTIAAMLREPPSSGMHRCRGRFLSTFAGFVPPHADALPGFALCDATELAPGFETGFWAEVPLVEMHAYMAHLVARYEQLGGSIERARVESLDDVAKSAPLVANCTGLGSRELVPDDDVTPMRGPKIVVENPGIDTFVAVGPPGPEGTYIHPHGDIVVLGGSAHPSPDTTPDPNEAAAIIGRCAAIEPRLLDAPVLEHAVGLRPNRPAIRLELERRGDTRVVHNYGHGGIGVTVCWGCAAEATRLLLE
jgi:D-amino-acid oxidase